MRAYDYILSKQIQWARNNEIDLIGSRSNRGRPAYTQNLDDNLFEPLADDIKRSFQKGDGGELAGNPSKMQAVHSSSALGVNIFHTGKVIKKWEKSPTHVVFAAKQPRFQKTSHLKLSTR